MVKIENIDEANVEETNVEEENVEEANVEAETIDEAIERNNDEKEREEKQEDDDVGANASYGKLSLRQLKNLVVQRNLTQDPSKLKKPQLLEMLM